MKQIAISLILGVCLFLSCATTSSVSNGPVDFSKFHSYAWTGMEQVPNDEAVARSPIMNPQITQIANETLATKGFTVDVDNPDLFATTYLVPMPKNNIGPPDDSRITERHYTLVLEFYESDTFTRVWRGWATVSVNMDNSEYFVLDRLRESKGDVSQSIKRVLSDFPNSEGN